MASVRTGRKREDPPKGAPSYMTTYGDMTTLLLVFFVFLFRVTDGVSEAKIDAAISSFRQAMGVFPSSISVLRPDEAMLVPKEKGTKDFWGAQKQLEELERLLRKEIKKMQDMGPGYLATYRGKKELRVRIGSQALFPSGATEVKEEFKPALDQLGEFIKTYNLEAVVEGHTDDRPISTARFPSNWELSVGRASNVVRYFIEQHGIPEEMLQASGYADTKPVASNDTPEGREKNRRIEIIFRPTNKTPASFKEKAQRIFGGASFE